VTPGTSAALLVGFARQHLVEGTIRNEYLIPVTDRNDSARPVPASGDVLTSYADRPLPFSALPPPAR
jgi:hypothetical protein